MPAIEIDAARAAGKMRALTQKVRVGVREAVAAGAQKLVARVRAKLSGEVLNARSGALRASIRAETDGTSARMSSACPYARIQEYGGRIGIPAIEPVNAKALAFAYGGRMVFAKRIAARVIDIPERSYMRSSLAEFAPVFMDDIRKLMTDATA